MRARTIYEQYCQSLEVRPGSAMVEFERSFREMVKVWHPDRFLENPELQIRATRKTSEITKAYQWIRRHEAFVKQQQSASSTTSAERILTHLRESLRDYLHKHPATHDEMVQRAVQSLLLDVSRQGRAPRPEPSRWFKEIRSKGLWQSIVKRRKVIVAWSLLLLLFLFLGSR